ncbi:hypothetical protein LTR47_003529 [Exophiala xenobiotica]|nr:hypothetical protein LTR92_008019 [Exophiala xenobiotica]KAK5235344.1 hypothetical protein LTR47_003529 [Exophiala xenobiotica]KAK5250027.1 hypothetical protein LTS06_005088 [Exophiala xenobiotica]KAK5369821.1 hypothetical protein LTR11_007153 [Exophiala xenobiotica]KAK5371854.1 hypothetical protein LTS03_006952 [Exophiala xenobiotica]
MSTVTIQHPTIGEVVGREVDGVHQFLGVQYATLENRLAESKVKTAYPSGGSVDATKHGPSSYYPPTAFDNEMSFIQQTIPKPTVVHSDLECLNLNITVPKTTGNSTGKKLPVFVWIHGGGFILGANSWPHYDHAKLVKLASERGVPVIGVGINFRLGFAGLLTSEELRSKGYKTNNQLRDQRNAFEWVKKYISGFGGDPDNVTAIAESAGAVATTLHLYSKEKVYNRAIATGGSCLLVPACGPDAYERVYQQVLGALGLDSLSSADERIERLLSMPADEVIAKIPPFVQFIPMVDGDMVPVKPSYAAIADPNDESMPGKRWADGLMIGDSQFDASVFGFMLGFLKPNIRQAFSKSIRNSFSSKPQVAETLLDSYGFTGSPAAEAEGKDDDDVAFMNFLQLATDIGYYAATTSFVRGWPESGAAASASKCYTFCFNEPNPWPGPFQGKATHVLDVAFLFQNYNDKLGPEQRAAAEGFGLDFMKFVAGQDPWPNSTAAHRTAKVFGPSNNNKGGGEAGAGAVTKVVDNAEESPEEMGRKKTILELGKEVGFDMIAQAMRNFQMGK